MTWNDITVFQHQQLDALASEYNPDDFDVVFKICAVVHGLTERELDSLPQSEFSRLCNELAFMAGPLPTERVKVFTHKPSGRRYRFVEDVRQIHAARYMEVKQYGMGGFIPNLHRMAASMVIPQQLKRPHLFAKAVWVDAPYDALKHEQYASDILEAPITAIYGSAVFFCNVFAASMLSLQDYWIAAMPTKEAKMDLQKTLADSWKLLDGNTTAPS